MTVVAPNGNRGSWTKLLLEDFPVLAPHSFSVSSAVSGFDFPSMFSPRLPQRLRVSASEPMPQPVRAPAISGDTNIFLSFPSPSTTYRPRPQTAHFRPAKSSSCQPQPKPPQI